MGAYISLGVPFFLPISWEWHLHPPHTDHHFSWPQSPLDKKQVKNLLFSETDIESFAIFIQAPNHVWIHAQLHSPIAQIKLANKTIYLSSQGEMYTPWEKKQHLPMIFLPDLNPSHSLENLNISQKKACSLGKELLKEASKENFKIASLTWEPYRGYTIRGSFIEDDNDTNPFSDVVLGKKDYKRTFSRLKKLRSHYKGKKISVSMDFKEKAFVKLLS